MSKPKAVLISDVHYSLNTLELADKSMRQAITKAEELEVPLIVAGDLHDSKANLRAECVNRMLETIQSEKTPIVILIGNHDLVNEKVTEHALNFLGSQVHLVDTSMRYHGINLIPYYHEPDKIRAAIKSAVKTDIFIMHQGLKSSNSGEYGEGDHSALLPEDVKGLRIISGHYHTRQTIPLPNNGSWDYIGNPYTMTFGEAADPEKGFQVLYEDGSLRFVPTNLRKHVRFNLKHNEIGPQSILIYNPEDLLRVTITGTKEQLSKFDRQTVVTRLGLHATQIKIDLLPESEIVGSPKKYDFDTLIDTTKTTDTQKNRLKSLWRRLT